MLTKTCTLPKYSGSYGTYLYCQQQIDATVIQNHATVIQNHKADLILFEQINAEMRDTETKGTKGSNQDAQNIQPH